MAVFRQQPVAWLWVVLPNQHAGSQCRADYRGFNTMAARCSIGQEFSPQGDGPEVAGASSMGAWVGEMGKELLNGIGSIYGLFFG